MDNNVSANDMILNVEDILEEVRDDIHRLANIYEKSSPDVVYFETSQGRIIQAILASDSIDLPFKKDYLSITTNYDDDGITIEIKS